ncbi:MAG TPA: GNAT family N-acetyltransferase [Solirubrobacterales bacterium]
MVEGNRDTAYDPAALDETERRFWREIWDSVPPEVASEHGIELKSFGPIQASVVRDLPNARMLNLVLGAAEADAVEGGHLESALVWAEAQDVNFYVPVSPKAPAAEATEDLLQRRGYEHGYAWMKFVRDASPPNMPEPDGVEVRELSRGEGEPLGRIGAAGFEMPPWAATLFSDLPGRPGWRCYVAVIDDEPQACAAMLINDHVAEFGIAATLESARGRGCQSALLHRRIVDAAEASCHTLFVETGERTADRPSASYRNILRAGFKEAYLRPNWQRAAKDGR